MRIAMLLSGGVDSATTLKLLIDAGHTAVTAYYLKVWLEDELHYLGDCPWHEDLRYARAVCEQLDVPLTVMPLQEAYWQEIVGYTLKIDIS
jgi:tRNA U34 2-thiouridine synthase MnmA/TrmU